MTIIRVLIRIVGIRCKLSFTIATDDCAGIVAKCPACGEVNRVTR